MPKTERRTLLLALLLAGGTMAGLAPPAAAQGTEADLQIVSFTAGNPRYRLPTTIHVLVENRGGTDYDPLTSGGFHVFVGWNGVADANCITAEEGSVGAPNVDKACYYRHRIDQADIPKNGGKLPISIPWTPIQRGEGTVYVQIAPLSNTQSADDATNQPDLPGEQSDNNLRTFPVTVHAPKVVAIPDRVPPPDTGDRNARWTFEQANATLCLDAPTQNHVGCRAVPGLEYRFAYNVSNQGTISDAYRGEVTYGTPDQKAALEALGWRFSLSPDPIAIAPGATSKVFLNVFVPEKQPHNEGVNVGRADLEQTTLRVRWHSSVNADVHTSHPQHCGAACSDPTLPTVVAGVRRAMNATTNESVKALKPTETATFNVRIENAGNEADGFNVTLVPDESAVNASWRPRISVPPSIPAGEARNATIDLTAPEDAPRGLYPFAVRVRSLNDTTGRVVANFSFTADLQQRWGLLTNLLPSSNDVAPGQQATYALTVTNTGNGQDNATIALSNVPSGWDVRLSETLVRLPPFGARTVQLNMTPVPGTAANARADVKVDVTSEGSNNHTGFPKEKALQVTASALVLSRPNVDVTLDGASRRFVDPTVPTDWTLTVRNVGNLASQFNVRLANPDPSWAAVATPPSLTLQPLETGTVVVSLRAPQDALVGEVVRVVATVESASVPDRLDRETIVGAVSGPDLAVKAVTGNTTAPYSGDPFAVDVVVANEGNKPPSRNATLRLVFIQAGVERVVDEVDYPAAELPAGRRFSQRLTWDTTGVEGPGVLVARLDPADLVREIDDAAASNEGSLAVVLRTFDVAVTPAQGLSGRPGEKLAYTERPHLFVVRHRGNQPTEPVIVTVQSEHGWVDADRATFTMDLPRGAEVPIPVEVLVPLHPGAAADALRVTVTPAFRPGSPVVASTTTRVIDEERPQILRVQVMPATAKLGDNVTIEAFVRDATGAALVRAILVSPSNDTTALPMAHVGGERWALQQTFTVAGPWRVFVEAADNADPPNVNASRDDLVPFTVDPGSAPVIRLAEGQPSVVRSGSPVRLNVTDPLGIARAAYVIRGIRHDMPRPFQIDTSGFPAGPVEVLVEAENLYGVKTQERIALTLDNTPPAIRKVTLTPESPRANEDATLLVETEAQVESVDVLLRRDGRVVETRAATRTGPGQFELLLNPGEGDYVLDVTAKDPAGNVKLEEGIVKFSAKPKSPFDVPAPGAWALLAALGLAALALGRRRGA